MGCEVEGRDDHLLALRVQIAAAKMRKNSR